MALGTLLVEFVTHENAKMTSCLFFLPFFPFFFFLLVVNGTSSGDAGFRASTCTCIYVSRFLSHIEIRRRDTESVPFYYEYYEYDLFQRCLRRLR